MLKEIEAEAKLAKCRALISQINAGLSAEEPFVDVSSATELMLYLERAATALNSAPKDTILDEDSPPISGDAAGPSL